MTSVAGDPSGVIGGGNLRKAFRFRGVGFVAASTDDRRVQFCWLHRTGVVGVPGLGPVASLAGNHNVLAEFLLIHNVAMAGLAGVMPGKRDRPGRDLADRGAAIVAILPKTPRNNSGPEKHKCHQRNGDNGRQANEVFNVFKQDRAFRANNYPFEWNTQCWLWKR